MDKQSNGINFWGVEISAGLVLEIFDGLLRKLFNTVHERMYPSDPRRAERLKDLEIPISELTKITQVTYDLRILALHQGPYFPIHLVKRKARVEEFFESSPLLMDYVVRHILMEVFYQKGGKALTPPFNHLLKKLKFPNLSEYTAALQGRLSMDSMQSHLSHYASRHK